MCGALDVLMRKCNAEPAKLGRACRAGLVRSLLGQFNLFKIKLDRGRTAEDRDRDLDPVLVEIEFLDGSVEATCLP
jgi:hypothetical protein